MLYHSSSSGSVEISEMANPHRINAAIKLMRESGEDFSFQDDTPIQIKQVSDLFGAKDYLEYAKLLFKDTKLYLEAAKIAYSLMPETNEVIEELLNFELGD